MKQYSLSEEQAYSWLKKRAMNLRKTMREVAEAVLISVE
jgi:AmiR/NasT family two-component response regulator